MDKKTGLSLKNDLPGIFACALAFFIPAFPSLVPLGAALIVVSLFIQPKKLKFHPQYRMFAFLFVAFYSCYVLGMMWNDHPKEGWFDLEVKLSFLIFPLVFLFHGPLKIQNLRILFACFVAGSLTATFICLYYGWKCYSSSGDANCFFAGNITHSIHASYLSVYFCFACLIIVHSLINYAVRMSLWIKLVNFFLLIYFSVFVLLLSSKSGFLAFALVIVVSVIYYFYKNGKIKNILLGLTALTLLTVLLFSFSSYVRARFVSVFETSKLSKEELFEQHRTSTESSAVRLMIWTVAKEIIEDHPLGVGTGDNKSMLTQKYSEYGMTGALEKKLNCHNQFLETTISVGFQGLAILVALLGYGMYEAIRKKNFLLLWVMAIITLSLFFESFFERQAGIVFFVFITWVLFTSVPQVFPVSDKTASPGT
ncbi:MAG: O-antigen ligase family protein [Bacteroidota bacterium]